MNLLEAMRIFVAVVERGGLSGAASELSLDDARLSERLDGLERYLGCRLLIAAAGGDVACTDAGVAFLACCRRTLSAVAQATGASGAAGAPGAIDPSAADACATISAVPVSGFTLPDAIGRVARASSASPTSLHRPSP
ncbi:LysR family transcriptional regulator [Burkholderia sp. Nafp2/4-1b]|nr:LysR family transcriptional regulator [Burkholderia sp. Nafp2/4-1b]